MKILSVMRYLTAVIAAIILGAGTTYADVVEDPVLPADDLSSEGLQISTNKEVACNYQEVIFSVVADFGQPPYQYHWSTSSDSASTVIDYFTDDVIASVTVTDDLGEMRAISDTVFYSHIYVDVPPVAVAPMGDSVRLTVRIEGNDPPYVANPKPGQRAVKIDETTFLFICEVNGTTAGRTQYMEVIGGSGCANSNGCSLIADVSEFMFTVVDGGNEFCQPASYKVLHAGDESETANRFDWYVNGTFVQSTDYVTPFLYEFSQESEVVVKAIFEHFSGAEAVVGSDTAAITASSTAVAFTATTDSDLYSSLMGSTVRIDAIVEGNTMPVDYNWYPEEKFSTVDLPIGTVDFKNITNPQEALLIATENGCSIGHAFTIVPDLTDTITVYKDSIYCSGTEKGLSVYFPNINSNESLYTIEWYEETAGKIAEGRSIYYSFTGDVNVSCQVSYKDHFLGSSSFSMLERSGPTVSLNDYTYYSPLDNGKKITPSMLGGLPSFYALWTPSAPIDNDGVSILVTLPSPQKYSVTVYDSRGCTGKAQTYLLPDSGPIAGMVEASKNKVCTGSEVVLSATAYGGSATPIDQSMYSFSWYSDTVTYELIGVGPQFTAAPLHDSTFYVIISYGGEADTLAQSISVYDWYDYEYTVKDPVCFGHNDGEIAILPEYMRESVIFEETTYYEGDTLRFSNLSPGFYPITVLGMDEYSETIGYCAVDTIVLAEPDPIIIENRVVLPATYGQADGSIEFTVTKNGGDLSSLEYSVNESPFVQASSPFTVADLESGPKMIVIADENGCETEEEFMVPEKININAEASINNILCAGGSTGSIELYPFGYDENKPIAFLWSTGSTEKDIFDLSEDEYTVTITGTALSGQLDTAVLRYDITQPDEYKFTITTQPTPYCKEKSGKATISIPETDDIIDLKWLHNSSSANMLDTLSEGTYTVLATNQFECVDTLTIEIGSTEPYQFDLGNDTVLCSGDSIQLVAGDRDMALEYDWNDGETSYQRYIKESGYYSVNIYDAEGCMENGAIYIGGVYDDPVEFCDLSVLVSGAVSIAIKPSELQRLEDYTIYQPIETPVKTMDVSEGSSFVDETSNPLEQSEKYYITGTTVCGDRTVPSNEVATIFVTSEIGVEGEHILSWNANDYAEFSQILSGPSQSELAVVADSIAIGGQTNQTYTIADAPEKTYYQVRVFGFDAPEECFTQYTSNIIYTSVYPKVDFTASPTVVAVGEQVELVAKTDDGADVLWKCPGAITEQSPNRVVKQRYAKPGTYSVTLLAQKNGYTDSVVKEDYITVIGITTPDTAVCPGSELVLSVPQNSDYTYEWSTGATTSQITIQADADTTISVKVYTERIGYLSDEINITVRPGIAFDITETPCAGDSLLVEFSGFETYSWNSGAFGAQSSFYITQPDSEYTISAQDSVGCTSTDTYTSGTFAPVPEPVFGSDTILCAGEQLAVSVPETYGVQWSTGSTEYSSTLSESGKYSVTLTLGQCSIVDSIDLTVAPKIYPAYAVVSVKEDGNAVVAWPEEPDFVSYQVLRETEVLDEYELVATVLPSDSLFSGDYSVDLRASNTLYQLKAIDTCGNASTITTNSIHLQADLTLQNFVDLTWSKFQGFAVPTYYIYRGQDAASMTLLTTITGTLQNYRDQHPVEGAKYVVAVDGQEATVPPGFLLGEWQAGKFTSNMASSGYTSPLPSIDFTANRTHVGVGSQFILTSLTHKADSYKWDIPEAAVSSLTDSLIVVSFDSEGFYSVSLMAANAYGVDTVTKTNYIQVGNVPVDSLRFMETDLQLAVGQLSSLELMFFPYDATEMELTFESSDDSTVFVKNGIAYAARKGSVSVVVTDNRSGATAEIEITVSGSIDPVDIVLPYALWVEAGSSIELEPVFVPFSLGTLPLEWSVSDTSLASIDLDGVFNAKTAGTVMVFGFDPISSLPVSVPITITESAQPANVILIPEFMEIAAGYAYNIPTAIDPLTANGSNIEWTVSETGNITVTADGVLKPTAPGFAYVIAQAGTVTDTCFLNIIPSKRPVLSGIDTVTILSGSTKEFFVLNNIEDDNTPAIDISWQLILPDQLAGKIENSIVFLTADAAFTGIVPFQLVATDTDMLTDTLTIVAKVRGLDTLAPVIALPNIAILKGTSQKTIFLPDYIDDNITSDTFLSTSVSESIAGAELSEDLNVLTIQIDPAAELFSEYFTLTAKDENGNISTKDILLTLSNKPNTKPVLSRIPNQQQTAGQPFETVKLTDYVQDDYTLAADIEWDVFGTKRLAAKIKKGKLFVYAKDVSWTGSEKLTITAIDEHGLSTERTVWYSQIAQQPEAWHGAPEVSFQASATYTVPGRSVELYGSVNGSTEMFWELPGATPESSRELIPVVKYAAQGTYNVSLSAQNEYGTTDLLKENYITVVGVNERTSTICAGESQALTIDAPGFTGFSWSTGENTQNISVSPEITTTYTVTISKGIAFVIDTVTVTVRNGLDLGNDTTLCAGDSIVLSAEGYDQYFWNGSDVAGTNSFVTKTAGTYSLLVKDASGCRFSDTFAVTQVLPKPEFSLGNDTVFCYNTMVETGTSLAGTYLWSTGAQTDSIAIDTTGVYTLSVTTQNGCVGTSSITATAKIPYSQPIGIVTIDSETGKNLIAWERPKDKDIVAYRVYRESDVAGDFDMIADQPFDQLSVVVDLQSEPNARQYTYGMTTIDGCGNESPMSATHTPIFLTQKLNSDGNVALSWQPYTISDGSSVVFKSYQIYRGTQGSALSEYKTVSASVKTYTDIEVAGAKTLYYRVAIILDNQVNPNVLKTDSGPFSQSMSNLAEAVVETNQTNQTTSAALLDAGITISPNPAIDLFTIDGSGVAETIRIADMEGITVWESNNVILPQTVQNIPVGMYTVQITQNGTVITGKVVVE